MIYIDRDRRDGNGNPIKPPNGWFKKAKKATDIALIEKGNHRVRSDVYTDRRMKSKLKKLFYDKCAYCRSRVTAGFDGDVEHFRPKKRVAKLQNNHPGYYWLIYDWGNLYLSCQHCNQKRINYNWNNLNKQKSAGKADQFPLYDESTRAMTPFDDYINEHTLIIDPCYDDPELYFGYNRLGEIISLEDNPYGEETIQVLNLKRPALTKARLEKLKVVKTILEGINDFKQERNQKGIDTLSIILEIYKSDDHEYAGLVRYMAKHPSLFIDAETLP